MPNWLDTAGHRRGTVGVRWVGPDVVDVLPSTRVVQLSELSAAAPAEQLAAGSFARILYSLRRAGGAPARCDPESAAAGGTSTMRMTIRGRWLVGLSAALLMAASAAPAVATGPAQDRPPNVEPGVCDQYAGDPDARHGRVDGP